MTNLRDAVDLRHLDALLIDVQIGGDEALAGLAAWMERKKEHVAAALASGASTPNEALEIDEEIATKLLAVPGLQHVSNE